MFERIAIVGVGFMGGSFALSVKSVLPCQIFGVDINPQALERAKGLKVIHEGSTNIKELRSFKPNLVVLATPVRTFESIAKSLKEGCLSEETIITDLGSVKGYLVYTMESILGSRFVGGHPIAGTEKSGVENSVDGLFKGKRTILTPTQRTERDALEKVKKLWELIGSKVEFMDPFLHDVVFGAVSHLPHAVAFALIDTLLLLTKRTGIDLFQYPGAGFKDFTRIAASDPIMWRDIFLENRENILEAIDCYSSSLRRLRELISEKKVEELTQYLKEARENRLRIE
ncbi:prephenate dehydrogenase/arogenate dehydrogenase family protein [Thermocrinis sp.]|uniref:prephenate dehydrogenase n=1 Tax=Thermocrinis sp. TaxID=2024383 RepID=UPI002FDCC506